MTEATPLEPLDGFVEALQRALDDAAGDGTLPGAPDLEAAVPLAVADLPAARALLQHMVDTRQALVERMASVAAELEAMAPRRTAARRYAQQDTGNF